MDSSIGLMGEGNCPICLEISSLDRKALDKDCSMAVVVVGLGAWAERGSTRGYGLEPIDLDGIVWIRDG